MYVTGSSEATWGNPERNYTGSYDAFAAKLDTNGSLTWNTFLGGAGGEEGNGIFVDGNGNVYVTGNSNATWGNPVRAYIDNVDAFVAKLDNTGALTWNTFLGGEGGNWGTGIVVDGAGVYVCGISGDWGVAPVRAYSANGDGFAAKLDSADGSLTWDTFLEEADLITAMGSRSAAAVFISSVNPVPPGGLSR